MCVCVCVCVCVNKSGETDIVKVIIRDCVKEENVECYVNMKQRNQNGQ